MQFMISANRKGKIAVHLLDTHTSACLRVYFNNLFLAVEQCPPLYERRLLSERPLKCVPSKFARNCPLTDENPTKRYSMFNTQYSLPSTTQFDDRFFLKYSRFLGTATGRVHNASGYTSKKRRRKDETVDGYSIATTL